MVQGGRAEHSARGFDVEPTHLVMVEWDSEPEVLGPSHCMMRWQETKKQTHRSHLLIFLSANSSQSLVHE